MSEMLQLAMVVVHVGAGGVALVAGPVAMFSGKGGKRHRGAGKVFFYAMLVIFVTALALSAWRFHYFLVGLAFLSFYCAFTGVRVLRLKRPERDRPTRLDWGAAVLQTLVGIAFLVRGLWGPLRGLIEEGRAPSQLAFLVLFFGVIIAWGGIEDLQRFRKPPTEPMSWWYHHINRMGGAYIAALTAFAVQSIAPHVPGSLQWMVWAGPAILGSILIARAIRKDRRRFSQAGSRSEQIAGAGAD